MARSTKKGPFIDGYLAQRIEGMNSRNEKKVLRTLAAPPHPHPGVGGPPHRVQKGKKILPRVHQEKQGGPKAGKFHFSPPVQGTLDEGRHRSCGASSGSAGWTRSDHSVCW